MKAFADSGAARGKESMPKFACVQDEKPERSVVDYLVSSDKF